MSQVRRFVLEAGILVMRFMYSLMKLLPVQDKYLFLSKLSRETPLDFLILERAVKASYPSYKTVVLCQPISNKAMYALHVIRQMYELATCKAVFLERSCLPIHVLKHRRSLRVVQLWHALGSMKKFGYAILDTPEGQSREIAELLKMHRGYTDILISSKTFLKDYEEGFGLSHTQAKFLVAEIPLPRVDYLLNGAMIAVVKSRILKEYPTIDSKKVILYCPTFRQSWAGQELAGKKLQELANEIDFNEYNLVYAPHPLCATGILDARVIKAHFTTQELLCVADVVVSDYSSIVYEAGLLHLPVYLYAYDWDEYRQSRSHNIDLEHDVPTVFSSDAREIAIAIENDVFDHAAFDFFIERNVTLPAYGTCCDAIIALLRESRVGNK